MIAAVLLIRSSHLPSLAHLSTRMQHYIAQLSLVFLEMFCSSLTMLRSWAPMWSFFNRANPYYFNHLYPSTQNEAAFTIFDLQEWHWRNAGLFLFLLFISSIETIGYCGQIYLYIYFKNIALHDIMWVSKEINQDIMKRIEATWIQWNDNAIFINKTKHLWLSVDHFW